MTHPTAFVTVLLVALWGCTSAGTSPGAAFPPVDESARTTDLELHADLRSAPGSRVVVLLVHGLGGSTREMVGIADSLHAMGYNTLALDLRGHGKSGGSFPVDTPTQYGIAADDVRGALRWVRGHFDTTTHRIVMVGISLGGGAVIANALENPDIPFIAWYPGLTYLHAGDSLVRAATPEIHGLIVQGTDDTNPRANPTWTRRFLAGQPTVGVQWVAGGAHGAGSDRPRYERITLDSIRAWTGRP